MSMLDDAAIFTAVIQQGGFSHAARHLDLSNGMISRRIAQLEEKLGVTLIKRTTRQIKLTPEGEIFWKHAQRMQQEMDAAVSLIQSRAKMPTGSIKVSAPSYFGRYYLMPIITKFLEQYPDISIDLQLSEQLVDPVKANIDLIIRGSGFIGSTQLKDSSLQMKMLLKEEINVYASPEYLARHGEPKSAADLLDHQILAYADDWSYTDADQPKHVKLKPLFSCHDVESRLLACTSNLGIGRFTDLNVKAAVNQGKLAKVLSAYNWGEYCLYAVYPQQKTLPKRTRLLLDYIVAHTQNLQENI